MAVLTFENLSFQEEDNHLKVIFYKQFSFKILKSDLKSIADFKINNNQIEFNCPEKRAQRKFNQLITNHIQNHKLSNASEKGLENSESFLRNNTTKNPAVYIHRNSNIPLIGNNYFGIIYRNTSIVEIKPQTSCNLNCIYCSVGEGIQSKQTDFIVEKDYLIEEFQKLLNYIDQPVEAHIGVHGEPFFYQDLIPLIHDLHQIKQVHTISLDTNATLLTKSIIDQLEKYPKLRLNISLNTLNPKTAQKLAGTKYNLKHVLNMVEYAAPKIELLIAPLLIPGYNEKDLLELIKFSQKLKVKIIGIQNFLNYKGGRNPAKAWPWDKFIDHLKDLEKQTNTKLLFDFKKDFNIKETKPLKKPFKKDQRIKVKIVSLGRFPNSRLAVADNRNITVLNCPEPINKEIKIKITRDKHNIFLAR
ncbi:MAG: radical SAM protein [Nanoarchaeota archaeon]|nr:radical SAM protein [Nanoarchaeota archaeon]